MEQRNKEDIFPPDIQLKAIELAEVGAKVMPRARGDGEGAGRARTLTLLNPTLSRRSESIVHPAGVVDVLTQPCSRSLLLPSKGSSTTRRRKKS